MVGIREEYQENQPTERKISKKTKELKWYFSFKVLDKMKGKKIKKEVTRILVRSDDKISHSPQSVPVDIMI